MKETEKPFLKDANAVREERLFEVAKETFDSFLLAYDDPEDASEEDVKNSVWLSKQLTEKLFDAEWEKKYISSQKNSLAAELFKELVKVNIGIMTVNASHALAAQSIEMAEVFFNRLYSKDKTQ